MLHARREPPTPLRRFLPMRAPRPTTDRNRAAQVNQPYAAESEDYQADHIEKPEADEEPKSRRSDRE